MVICLEQGADLHMVQLMPLLLTVSCFSKIQIGFTFLVSAHLGSPGQRAVKRVCVCVCNVLARENAKCQDILVVKEKYGRTMPMVTKCILCRKSWQQKTTKHYYTNLMATFRGQPTNSTILLLLLYIRLMASFPRQPG